MKRLYIWFVLLFQKLFTKGGHPTVADEVTYPLKLNLQFFADGEDEDEDEGEEGDEGDGEEEDDAPNLDELLKDREFKKQYNARLKEQLAKRMKKHDAELERLKGDKPKDKKKDDPVDESELAQELKDKTARLERAERREKRAMVKEYAADNGHNPKLLARLINIDDIELDEDGEPENLEDLFDELEEEFPEYFGEDDDGDGDEETPTKKKKSAYAPGARQKTNKKKKVDPKEAGRLKALERHKKEETK